jgi:hypothetical protein
MPRSPSPNRAPVWPKSKLLRHGPELTMAARVARYQQNIRTIRAFGCKVPSVMPDTLNAVVIEAWFVAAAETSRRLRAVIRQLAQLDPLTTMPMRLAPLPEAKQRGDER